MEAKAEEVIEQVFSAARADDEAASVAPLLERAHREGRWSAEQIVAALSRAEERKETP